MTLSELLSKRLILLSGKGGVGKTTMVLCLGLMASRLKKKTLIVEMNSTERVAPYFGLKKIGHKEIPLAPYLTGINLDPHECFEEYVLNQIRFKKIFDLFINNRFVTSFLNAVPGFNELLMIGKVYDLEKQTKGKVKKEKLYDLIIVDGPSTGHGISAFEVPTVVTRMVKVGPIKKHASHILDLLNDRERCAYSVVTLAEEMPVVEATELVQLIDQNLKIQLGPLFLNNVHRTGLTGSDIKKLTPMVNDPNDPLHPYYAYAQLDYERSKLNQHYKEELISRNKNREVIVVPHLLHPIALATDLKPIVDQWVGEDHV